MADRKSRSSSSNRARAVRTSWDPLADWYDGWVGPDGSKHHRKLAIPALLELLEPRSGERILDLGAGQGVLAPYVARSGASYTGVDVSPRLLRLARRHHQREGRFLQGDVCRLAELAELKAGEFDGAAFLLSIQDMDPLEKAVESAAWALRSGGRLAILMTHPCFRIPRQSGWGWDEGRRLRYRRVDRYLTPLAVPLKPYQDKGGSGVTRSFHRPLQVYVEALSACGLWLDRLREIPAGEVGSSGSRKDRAIRRAEQEIPLFLALRAIKVEEPVP